MVQEAYVSIFDSTEYKDYVAARDAELPDETEEEKRRRLERERLAAIQAEQPVAPPQPQEVIECCLFIQCRAQNIKNCKLK